MLIYQQRFYFTFFNIFIF